MKKFLSVLLAVIMALSVFSVCGLNAFADDASAVKNLKILCQNVAGLPIPSAFSDNGKVVPTAQKALGELMNESGADIICVQEDFQFHSILKNALSNYEYSTCTSGGIPVGDGVNIFSKYPIYNVQRVAWDEEVGVLTNYADSLTPKGFVKVTVDIDGVLVDLYNGHWDAGDDGVEADEVCKAAQFEQMFEFMEENSKDRPVIITGDFNATFHTDLGSQMYEIVCEREGFTDAWAHNCNNDNYLHGDDKDELIAKYYEENNGQYWGIWDSVERYFYRDGDGLKLDSTKFEYINYTTDENDTCALTDHNAAYVEISLDTADYVRPDVTLKKEVSFRAFTNIFKFVWWFVRDLFLIIKDLPNVI